MGYVAIEYQLVHYPFKVGKRGQHPLAIPILGACSLMVKQVAFNHKIEGSSPSRHTNLGVVMSLCTMTVQVEIKGKTLESYEKNRDKFISKLEKMGCDVIIEDDGEDEEE
jgi:hypothetical protein